jgi:predicted ABC-type ATPase
LYQESSEGDSTAGKKSGRIQGKHILHGGFYKTPWGATPAGKTTFARRFIPATVNITQFVNADLIAAGLSPFAPEREAIQAGKLMLRQINKLISQGESFCFETTLAGRSFARMIPQW